MPHFNQVESTGKTRHLLTYLPNLNTKNWTNCNTRNVLNSSRWTRRQMGIFLNQQMSKRIQIWGNRFEMSFDERLTGVFVHRLDCAARRKHYIFRNHGEAGECWPARATRSCGVYRAAVVQAKFITSKISSSLVAQRTRLSHVECASPRISTVPWERTPPYVFTRGNPANLRATVEALTWKPRQKRKRTRVSRNLRLVRLLVYFH